MNSLRKINIYGIFRLRRTNFSDNFRDKERLEEKVFIDKEESIKI